LAQKTLAQKTLAQKTLAQKTLAQKTLAQKTLAQKTLAKSHSTKRTGPLPPSEIGSSQACSAGGRRISGTTIPVRDSSL
jgi:hypothetical protein